MFSLKFSFVLLLSVLSLPALLSMADPNGARDIEKRTEKDIETIMSEAESRGLSVVYNTNGRTLPLIFNPLSKLLTAINPSTVLKVGLLYSAGLYLMTILFPAAFGISARSARASPFDFNLDSLYSNVYESSERMATFLQIPDTECRYRAVCETATYIATKIPAVNEWAKKVSGAFFLNLANPYSKAWINGMMQIDCATTYYMCEESPFKTIMDKFVAKK